MIGGEAPATADPAGSVPLALALTRGGEEVRAFLACAPASWARAVERRRGEVLHESELRTHEGMRFEKRRDEFLLGRFAAKVALGRYLGERDWTAIEVFPGIFQQPLVRHAGTDLAAVCITHSGGAAVAAAFPAAHPLAIDLERLDADRLEVLKSQVGPAEVETAGLPGDEVLRRVTMLWAAKEALSKVLRCGLTCPFEVLAVESVTFGEGTAEGAFRNFGQYRFESSVVGPFAFGIVLPRKSSLGGGVAEWLAARVEGAA